MSLTVLHRTDSQGNSHEYPCPVMLAEIGSVLYIPTGIEPELYTEAINDGSKLTESLLTLGVCYTNKEDALRTAAAFHDVYIASEYKNITGLK